MKVSESLEPWAMMYDTSWRQRRPFFSELSMKTFQVSVAEWHLSGLGALLETMANLVRGFGGGLVSVELGLGSGAEDEVGDGAEEGVEAKGGRLGRGGLAGALVGLTGGCFFLVSVLVPGFGFGLDLVIAFDKLGPITSARRSTTSKTPVVSMDFTGSVSVISLWSRLRLRFGQNTVGYVASGASEVVVWTK
ncbi:hypothetical protein BKA57DRAFT_468030 [Linnemannia elongata]|nr:hypothetical protein BKA57DRAFT_468030 [Linnemannia elongata]